ncbi:hypothetical protein FG379_000456 [Cryptosporidium bovis]|uniref:uncharacterized protein n=1 Tax=Cryptosporidium bovis TaxID=310047 RepID=UPI00351A9995|nr:hypothetical protein FG379_000456 [Cryptosporidium bovis]
MKAEIIAHTYGYYGKSEADMRNEINLFLTSIYLMNDNVNSNEFENLRNNVDDIKQRESKRMKLSEVVDENNRKSRIYFEKTRRLITHLCNEGKYDFIYNTFESIYMHTWKINMENISKSEFLRIIGEKKSEYDLNSQGLDIFILELIFDSKFYNEMINGGQMNSYMSELAKFWCHHRRSTDIISNVYLYFDSMFKRFGPGIFQNKNNYRGFINNANTFLKKIIFGELNIDYSSFKNKLEIEKHEFNNLPLCLIGGLVSIMINMNVIRDKYFNYELDTDFGKEMEFFILKKIFEMFIQLGIADFGVSKIYLNVMGRYYYEKIRNDNITEFKDYLKFLKMAIDLERSFLITQANNKKYHYEEDNIPENDDKNESMTENNHSGTNLNNSLLLFIRNDYWTEDFPLSKKRTLEISCINWNSYMENTELMLLDVLISDDIISRFSRTIDSVNKSYLRELVINDDYSSLEFIYNLFKKKKSENKVINEIKTCITDIGIELSMKLIRCNKHEYDLYISTTKKILDLYLKIEKICRESFKDNDKIRNICINDSWTIIANYNDEISEELMYGLSLFVYNLLSADSNDYSGLEESGIIRTSRVNMDLLCWLNKTEQNSSMLKFVNKDCNDTISKYLRGVMFVFKCSNKKEIFQNYYLRLFSQRLIGNYIPNKVGFGLNAKNTLDLYRMVISKEKGSEIIEMLNTKINLFEMYFMFLLYNECGYSFINKFNFIIRDWYLSSSIFKLYILCDSFNKNTDINIFFKEKENSEIKFSSYSKRLSRISNSSSYIYDKINAWLKLEDLGFSEASNNNTKNDDYNEMDEKIELKKDKIINNMDIDIPFSIIVLSSSNWSFLNKSDNFIDSELFINYKDKDSDINLIYSEMTLYQQYYKNIYSRNLIWSCNLGTCIVEYLPPNLDSYCNEIGIKRLDIKLILTLQQAILLLCFNNNDNVYLSSNHYDILKDNIYGLFRKNKVTILSDNSRDTVNKVAVSPILNIKEENMLVISGEKEKRMKDKNEDDYLLININDEFLNKENVVSIYNEIGDLVDKNDTALLVIDYVNCYYCEVDNSTYMKQLSLNSYLDSFITPKEDSIMNKEDYIFGTGESELDSIKSLICNTFKNNRYKVDAMIIRYLKFRKRSSFVNITELITKELFSTYKNSFGIDNQESKSKKSIIEDETSKCLDSLIQRDLIEIDSSTNSNSRDQQIYCYVP